MSFWHQNEPARGILLFTPDFGVSTLDFGVTCLLTPDFGVSTLDFGVSTLDFGVRFQGYI